MMKRFHGATAKLVNDLLPDRHVPFWEVRRRGRTDPDAGAPGRSPQGPPRHHGPLSALLPAPAGRARIPRERAHTVSGIGRLQSPAARDRPDAARLLPRVRGVRRGGTEASRAGDRRRGRVRRRPRAGGGRVLRGRGGPRLRADGRPGRGGHPGRRPRRRDARCRRVRRRRLRARGRPDRDGDRRGPRGRSRQSRWRRPGGGRREAGSRGRWHCAAV